MKCAVPLPFSLPVLNLILLTQRNFNCLSHLRRNRLLRYRQRLEQHQAEIVKACSDCVAIKSRLGLAERLKDIPEDRLLPLLKKPVLVIGGCSRIEVREILDGTSEWNSLLEGLQKEAAGLILCGNDGCQLGLRTGTQSRVFDDARF